MVKEYEFINELHSELEAVHNRLKQYEGVTLENGYETGMFVDEEILEKYQGVLDSHEDFEEKAGILRAYSSFEETAKILLESFGEESITIGKIPIKGPIGSSFVENVDLNYNIEIEDDGVRDYLEIDTDIINMDNRETKEHVRAIESAVTDYVSAEVEETSIESDCNALNAAKERTPS